MSDKAISLGHLQFDRTTGEVITISEDMTYETILRQLRNYYEGGETDKITAILKYLSKNMPPMGVRH